MADPDEVIRAAEEVAGILESRGVVDVRGPFGLDPLIEEATGRESEG